MKSAPFRASVMSRIYANPELIVLTMSSLVVWWMSTPSFSGMFYLLLPCAGALISTSAGVRVWRVNPLLAGLLGAVGSITIVLLPLTYVWVFSDHSSQGHQKLSPWEMAFFIAIFFGGSGGIIGLVLTGLISASLSYPRAWRKWAMGIWFLLLTGGVWLGWKAWTAGPFVRPMAVPAA